MLLLFWSLTFGMGGVLVGIYFLTETNFALQQDLSLVTDSPLPLYMAGLLIFLFLSKTLVDYVNEKKTNFNFEYEVMMFVENCKLSAKGFLDSGNQLCDKKTGLPVVIITSSKLKKFFAKKLADVVDGTCLLKDVHYTKFATLSGGVQKMLVFGIDRVEINGHEQQVVFGIANQKACFNCDLLLNAKQKF